MAGVALLGSPRSFMAKSSNFSGSGRKTVVTPFRLVTYNRPTAITTEPQLSPPSSRSVHRTFPVGHSMHWAVPGPALTMKTFPPTTTPEPTRCVCFSSHSRLEVVTSPAPPSLKPNVGPLTHPENATPISPETTGDG